MGAFLLIIFFFPSPPLKNTSRFYYPHPMCPARGDLESVQKYINTGGDLERMDWDNCTALHIACAGAFAQVAQLVREN